MALALDADVTAQAAAVLGTDTAESTVRAARREVVDARSRREAIELLREPGRLDVQAIDGAWGDDG